MRVHGVDFSGAKRAGEKVWIATAELDGGLTVTDCRPTSEAFGAADRETVLPALREFIRDADGPVGLDCSFGLPRAVHDCVTYVEVLDLVAAFDSPRAMRDALTERARAETNGERTYLARKTDERTGASSPYHWLVSHQTYYGLREVIGPLARAGHAVHPMTGGEGRLVEVYPAATLRALDLPATTYKDREGSRGVREDIVAGLEREGVTFEHGTRSRALEDGAGDALDGVVAAFAVARNVPDFRVEGDVDPLEGHIFV